MGEALPVAVVMLAHGYYEPRQPLKQQKKQHSISLCRRQLVLKGKYKTTKSPKHTTHNTIHYQNITKWQKPNPNF